MCVCVGVSVSVSVSVSMYTVYPQWPQGWKVNIWDSATTPQVREIVWPNIWLVFFGVHKVQFSAGLAINFHQWNANNASIADINLIFDSEIQKMKFLKSYKSLFYLLAAHATICSFEFFIQFQFHL